MQPQKNRGHKHAPMACDRWQWDEDVKGSIGSHANLSKANKSTIPDLLPWPL